MGTAFAGMVLTTGSGSACVPTLLDLWQILRSENKPKTPLPDMLHVEEPLEHSISSYAESLASSANCDRLSLLGRSGKQSQRSHYLL